MVGRDMVGRDLIASSFLNRRDERVGMVRQSVVRGKRAQRCVDEAASGIREHEFQRVICRRVSENRCGNRLSFRKKRRSDEYAKKKRRMNAW